MSPRTTQFRYEDLTTLGRHKCSETGEALRLADASGELGQPTLAPVLIEGPPVPTPWRELSHLHFNDKLLYLMT